MRTNPTSKGMRQQRGFSIVELMVSILIGLIILAGVVQVVITSKTSFIGQEEMSFIQENARYAVNVIGKDIQNAGHWGCAGPGAKTAFVGKVEQDAAVFMAFSPLLGLEGSDTSAVATPDIFGAFRSDIRTAKDSAGEDIQPDSIVLRGLQGQTYTVKSHVNGMLNLTGNHPFDAGDYVGVVDGDCRRLGVFRASGKADNTITYGTDGNFAAAIKPSIDKSLVCSAIVAESEIDADGNEQTTLSADCGGTPSSAQLYTNAATVMPYQAKALYIGNSSAFSGDVPALKRAVLKNGTVVNEEIALGVEDMQILYGQTNGTGVQYHEADDVTDWPAVTSVRVELLFRSHAPVMSSPQVQEFFDGKSTYNDRFARQLVSSTFRLRNRL